MSYQKLSPQYSDNCAALLQPLIRDDLQKATGSYAGHIEMGNRKQTDYWAGFWHRKLIGLDTVASIPAFNRFENEGWVGRKRV